MKRWAKALFAPCPPFFRCEWVWWARREERALAHPTISALALQRAGKVPLQHGARDGVGLLQVDAPIFQFVERDARIGHGAADIGSRRDHAEIAIQILHLRFAMARGAEFIQHVCILRLMLRRGPAIWGRVKYYSFTDLS